MGPGFSAGDTTGQDHVLPSHTRVLRDIHDLFVHQVLGWRGNTLPSMPCSPWGATDVRTEAAQSQVGRPGSGGSICTARMGAAEKD